MFNSIALDVVISLVFIYLLYSLLATVISEIIATNLGLRARNLKEAVDRMLNDEKEAEKPDHGYLNVFFWLADKLARIWDSVRLMKNPDNPVINNFYNHPEIKYLGSSGLFKNPSSFKAVSFSKTLLFILFGDGTVTKEKVDAKLKEIVKYSAVTDPDELKNKVLDPETAKYIHSMWEEANGDLSKFRSELENWFDRTMEQATEWYKRKIQIVLLVLGLSFATFFNADTFVIIKKLSTDKDARDKMVSMANAYIATKDSAINKPGGSELDSLMAVKKRLDVDMENANSILGSGGWLPDRVTIKTDPRTNTKIYTPKIDISSLSSALLNTTDPYLEFTTRAKICALMRLFISHFFGFLTTAIAISLGAPFWFDLLNKLMKLRTSTKQQPDDQDEAPQNVTPQPLVVHINTQNSEEAVG